MSVHHLPVDRSTLHGRFDASIPPVLIVSSGDTVVTSTLDCGWHAAEQTPRVLDAASGPVGVEALTPWTDGTGAPVDRGLDPGHALVGPVAVRGARPGMVVEVRVLDLVPGRWGFTVAGGRQTFADRAARVDHLEREALLWHIDAAGHSAIDQHGDEVLLAPFLGVMGLCPAGDGPVSTIQPRRVGGNLDCRELVAGSSLFLPVEVDGGLLSVGDAHGAQGDGEAAGVALECPLERVELRLVLHESPPLDVGPVRPWASTPAGDLVLGVGATIDDAVADALDGVVDLLVARRRVSRQRALALASLGVDLRLSQVVNGGVFGAHALVSPERVRFAGRSGHRCP